MQVRISFFALVVVLLSGCAKDHFATGRGYVGNFILQQAIARGGTPVSTNGLWPIVGRWRYSEDKYGVVIRMSREQYPGVESFLHQAFGEPKFGPVDTTDGGKLGVYRLSDKGGGIQFGYDAKETQITIIRPMSTDEILQGVVKATKKMGKSP